MFFIHWLSRTSRRNTSIRQPSRDRTKERRLKLLRLEERRVLNADFTFAANALTLDNIDGDLTVREVSGSTGLRIEFDLHGSMWQDDASTGVFAIDNSTPGHSILSIAKSDLESLASGVSLQAAASEFDLQFDVQSSALDLSQMRGTLSAEGFGQIQQTAANDHAVRLGDVSLSADHITLSQFHADDITLNANEIDLTGGADSFSGSTLSIYSAATPNIELGGTSDTVHELNFTDSDITALDAGFHRISFEATAADATSSIRVDSSGADFQDAIVPGHDGSLHLTADSVQIDGALSISGGLIDVTATHAATISATGSLVSHGGQVHVDAGESGTLLDSGRIDVSNSEPGGIGGTVHLLGEQVGLFGNAEVDASGDSGGGKVLIGGDLYGDNDAIPHAAQTYIGHDVEIHADAIQQGNGGQVVVWSDEFTQVYGTLTARGGALLGDGGLIETSSKEQLIVTRGGDASAANGNAGTWLLDPLNIRIVSAPSAVYLVTEFAPLPNFTPTVVGSEVTADAIVDQLKTGTTVVISTFNPDEMEDGDVIQEALIDVPFDNMGDSATLIINAANHIFINGGINATNGSLNVLLVANDDADDLNSASGNVNINADINTNGGWFSSTGVDFDSAGQKVPLEVVVANTAANITATGGVSITHTGTVDLGVISTGMGFGGTTFISDANVRGAINVGEGNVQIDGGNDGLPDSDNDDLHVLANITATDTVFLLADRDVIVEATVTVGGPTLPLNPSADLSITSDANSNGDGGFWLKEIDNPADAQLNAGGNITIVGAKLFDATGNPGSGEISLRIDADDAMTPQQQIVAGQDLTVVANFGNVSDAGDIVIEGIMEATDGVLTVFFTETAFLGADQTAGTDLLFQNAVQLTNDVTITAGTGVTFASTVDDDGDHGTGSALIVTGPTSTAVSGDVLYVGTIGATNGLDALTITGDGLIDFLSAVTVDGNISVIATSESGRITFQDAVTTTNGGSVTITNAGLLVTSSSATFNVATDFMQNGAGSTELGAGIKTTDGNVSFAQGVLLTRAQQTDPPDPLFDPLTTIDTSAGNGNITFSGTIDSEVAGQNEEQTISLANLTGATFTISWDPPNPPGTAIGMTQVIEMTASIAKGATAADVKAALVALPSLTDADISVTGDPGGPFTLTFLGAFRGTNVNEVTLAGDGLPFPAPAESASDPVLTTIQGQAIVAEHNPLTLTAGTGIIQFAGDIGGGFVDVGLGVDGDQTPGNLTVTSASQITFTNVALVVTNGTIDLGAGASVITNGIDINGTLNSITFQSRPNQQIDQNIRINGQVSSDVDLSLLATGDVLLTDDGSIFTNAVFNGAVDRNVTIVADFNGDSVGALIMNPNTEIDVGSGFIDVLAAEVFLGKLTSQSTNPTDAEHPAIRVVAAFGAITDINGDSSDAGLNLVANVRDPAGGGVPGAGVVLEAVLGIGSSATGDDALETDLASLSAYNHDRPEQQVITLENATGGTFRLTFDPPGAAGVETTVPIAFDASAADVKAALVNEQQTISLANATGGAFTISWDPPGATGMETTTPIAFDATADVVKNALLDFSSLTDADVTVIGAPGGPYTLMFLSTFGATNVDPVTIDSTGLTGAGATASVLTTVNGKPTDDIDVSGETGGPYLITFSGTLRVTNVSEIEKTDVNLIGVNADVMITTITHPVRAENNIRLVDTGTTAGRVDLIFVHNEANQNAPQFANATQDFRSDKQALLVADPTSGLKNREATADGRVTTITFSAATPGQASNNIVINFTIGNDSHDGATEGVPIITIAGHEITIDLDPTGTTANALVNAINSDHEVNQLVRAFISVTANPDAPGAEDITRGAKGLIISLSDKPAGDEDGVIDITVENGDLRVVADNSRLVLSEMQRGIDTFNPPDLAVAAVQSENTIKLTAGGTIEVFDDILAIQPLTQITAALTAGATTFSVVDLTVFDFVSDPAGPAAGNFIQINTEIMRVMNINADGNVLTVVRGQKGTTAVAHGEGTVIANIDSDNGFRGYIDIQAGKNFVLGADRVISTDDHYINSLNLAEDLNGNGKLDKTEDGNGDNILQPAEDYNGNGMIDVDETTDTNGNGVIDRIEDFNGDGKLQFNTGEDLNRNGVLDLTEDKNGNGTLQAGEDLNGNGILDLELTEDTNGNGILDLRGNKPATTRNDDFFSQINHDVIHITADSTFTGDNGRVLLGENSTISTDNGIEQLISPRPVFNGVTNGVFNFQPGTAYFSGDVMVSELTTRFLQNDEVLPDGTTLKLSSVVFQSTVTFTIGAPGEKNLVLDIDWGDHDRTLVSEIPPTTANTVPPRFDVALGVYVFDPTKDQNATRYLIPEGGAKYSIPHEFSQNAFNLKAVDGRTAINEPGRGIGVTTNPIQVRFAVSQHPSIVIDGQSVLDPRVAPNDIAAADTPADVPVNAFFDRTDRPVTNPPSTLPPGKGVNFPYAANDPALFETGSASARLFRLSGTDVSDDTDLFLPRFDNGIIEITIPTPPSSPISPVDVIIPPPALPSPFIPNAAIITAPPITTETSRSSGGSSSITTDEYFELRRINEDGSTTISRLTELEGESLLKRSQFEEYVGKLGDGEYEIFFITREVRDGTKIERSVIQFRLESGRLAPPANDSPDLFQPFRLIPVPNVPQPVPPKADGAAADKNSDAPNDGTQKTSDDEMSALPLSGTALAAVDAFAVDAFAVDSTSAPDSATPSPIAVGLLLAAGTRWRKNRFSPCGSSPFSKIARLARKRVAPVDDQ